MPQILALSCLDILEKENIFLSIKWPNDLLLKGKKCGGILCEALPLDQDFFVILGIGLNINMPKQYLETISSLATSLLHETQKVFDIEKIKKSLLHRFLNDLTLFTEKGFSPFYPRFSKALCHISHTPIQLKIGNTCTKGLFHSINQDGSLNLESEGEIIKYVSGEIFF